MLNTVKDQISEIIISVNVFMLAKNYTNSLLTNKIELYFFLK